MFSGPETGKSMRFRPGPTTCPGTSGENGLGEGEGDSANHGSVSYFFDARRRTGEELRRPVDVGVCQIRQLQVVPIASFVLRS